METDLDDVLEMIGFGWTQVLMLVGSSLIVIYALNEILGVSITQLAIACEFNLTYTDLFLLTSAVFAGMIVSAHYAGYKADLIGRRKSTIYALILTCAASLISLIMPEFYSFLFFRFLTGVFLSGVYSNAITYLMEFTKMKLRPSVANFLTYSVALSSIIVPLVAHSLEPLDVVLWSMGSFHVRVWRLCMLLLLIPGVFGCIVFWMLPESAKFLLAAGDAEGAFKILNLLYLRKRGVALESIGVKGMMLPPILIELDRKPNFFKRLWKETIPLFKPPYVQQWVLVTVIVVGYFFVGNGFALWFTKIRHQLVNDEMILCDHIEADVQDSGSACANKPVNYIEGFILGVSGLCGCIFITLMLFVMSRRNIMCLNAAISAVSGLILNFIKHKTPQLLFMVIFIAMCTSTISLAVSAVADTVPTLLRGKAVSLTLMFARSSVVIANCIIGHILYDHCLVTFNFFVLCLIAITILTRFLKI